jgi:serine phosphatase RsbU (regulator of sigma subunit)
VPALDPGELARLLDPLAAATGGPIAVDGPGGAEIARSGGDGSCPARADVVVRAQTIASVRAGRQEQADGVARLLADVLGRRRHLETELESMATELLDRYEEVTLLHGLARSLGAELDVTAVSEKAIAKALQVIPAERAFVALAGDPAGRLLVEAAHGDDALVGVRLAEHGIGAELVATGNRRIFHDDEEWRPGDLPERREGEAVLAVPLVATGVDGEEQSIGVLVLAGRDAGQRFSAGDASLAGAVASQLAGAISTSRTVRSLAAAENLRREVEIAAGIQRSLLPDRPPVIVGASVGARCVPADDVGGDLYDLIVDRRGRLALVIADVAGHGIGSALMMAMARAILRREIAEEKGPAAVLAATNQALFADLVNAGLFITIFCATYDPETRTLVYACGGQNPPLRVRAAGGEVDELQADGMPAGILPDVEFEEREVQLAPGDVVVLYTDGVVEARDADGDQFGEERLHDAVGELAGAAPEEVIARIMGAVGRHVAGAPARDDSTMVVLAIGDEA